MHKHFEKIDRHLQYDLLIIVSILSFFACYFLIKFITIFENAIVLGSSLVLIGLVTLGFAVIDYIRFKIKQQNGK